MESWRPDPHLNLRDREGGRHGRKEKEGKKNGSGGGGVAPSFRLFAHIALCVGLRLRYIFRYQGGYVLALFC